jgi:hypothetical protein
MTQVLFIWDSLIFLAQFKYLSKYLKGSGNVKQMKSQLQSLFKFFPKFVGNYLNKLRLSVSAPWKSEPGRQESLWIYFSLVPLYDLH